MKKIGIIGGRGMVGTALLARMEEEGDFKNFEVFFFSTSMAGRASDLVGSDAQNYLDANDIDQLFMMDIILTVQGSDHSRLIYPKLMERNYKGHYIDGSSAYRMDKNSQLLLDPVNGEQIKQSIAAGKKLLVGSNCTVSLMLLGIQGLLDHDLVDWISSQTYQAVSGAGSRAINEYIDQVHTFSENKNLAFDQLPELFNGCGEFALGGPIFGNLLPWIDADNNDGQSKEEWKAELEASRILGRKLLVDGTCVRVGSLRVHAQALTIGLKKDVPQNEIEGMIKAGNEQVSFIENTRQQTLGKLTPYHFQKTLDIGVGRVRKIHGDKNLLNMFTLGDQLLWGAAEPLRRALYLI